MAPGSRTDRRRALQPQRLRPFPLYRQAHQKRRRRTPQTSPTRADNVSYDELSIQAGLRGGWAVRPPWGPLEGIQASFRDLAASRPAAKASGLACRPVNSSNWTSPWAINISSPRMVLAPWLVACARKLVMGGSYTISNAIVSPVKTSAGTGDGSPSWSPSGVELMTTLWAPGFMSRKGSASIPRAPATAPPLSGFRH